MSCNAPLTGRWTSISCRRGPGFPTRVPYLAFADNMLIFARFSSKGLDALANIFGYYQSCSGQKINVGKSSFLISKWATEDQCAMVSSKLGFQRQGFPFTYLGAPLMRDRPTCVVFDAVVAKLRARLLHWSTRLLSPGEKLVLLRHVLTSIPMYVLQVLQPPKAVFAKLEKICNAFLWDKSTETRGIYWMAWEKLYYPVDEGVGAKVLRKYELSLPLCSGLLGHGDDWRRLGDELKSKSSGVLGKDLSTFGHPPAYVSGGIFGEGNWKIDRLREWVPAWVIHLVQDIHIYPDQENCMVWLGSTTREFSLKSAWATIRQHWEPSQVDRMVWNGLVPLKVSFFVWRLVHNLIPLEGRFSILQSTFSFVSSLLLAWFYSSSGGTIQHIRVVVPLLVLWRLWKARNNARFDSSRFEATTVIVMVEQVMVSWKRPPPHTFKLNTNASVVHGRATGGGVLRNSSGRLMFAFYKEFGDKEVLVAENLAVLHGLQLCRDRQIQSLLVEVDSQALVQLIHSARVSKWPLCNTLHQIRHLLASLSSSVSHIFREANSSSDRLANWRRGMDWFCTSPQQLSSEVGQLFYWTLGRSRRYDSTMSIGSVLRVLL
nr:uncharacterized protein LOC113705965 [Coffea arabica]